MLSFVKNLMADESGQGMVEYGLILALVSVVVIVALGLLGDGVNEIFENVTDALGGAE